MSFTGAWQRFQENDPLFLRRPRGRRRLRSPRTPALPRVQPPEGHDLRPALPLLYFDGGRKRSGRCDYLEVVTGLYDAAFWRGLTDRVKARGLGRTGHGWEDRLAWAAAFHGDLFTIERGLDPVGVDSLVDFGRQPIAFKVTQSVADFEGRRFMCENQSRTDSYLDMEGLRRGTNGINWGVDFSSPRSTTTPTRRITRRTGSTSPTGRISSLRGLRAADLLHERRKPAGGQPGLLSDHLGLGERGSGSRTPPTTRTS
jgi:hypothetical protein